MTPRPRWEGALFRARAVGGASEGLSALHVRKPGLGSDSEEMVVPPPENLVEPRGAQGSQGGSDAAAVGLGWHPHPRWAMF